MVTFVVPPTIFWTKIQMKSTGTDNTTKFFSDAFNVYCEALGIEVQYSATYVHTKNGCLNL
jgi:hypothetical protein